MKIRAYVINISMFIVVFMATIFGVEYFCKLQNEKNGIILPFLYKFEKHSLALDKYRNFDGLLGYAYHDGFVAPPQDAFPMTYQDGFVVYGTNKTNIQWDMLERPVIVALGGSTTEPNRQGVYNSWPEEMAKLMREKGVQGTVINGGVGGYSSSQELLKFIRDVIEIKPDVVITYHGVNEDEFSPVPHPMNVPYLYTVLDDMLQGKRDSSFFPNIFYYYSSIVSHKKEGGIQGISTGVATNKTQAGYLVRNVEMMNALAEQYKIKHVSILQPYIMTGNFAEFLKKNKPEFYAEYALSDEEISRGKAVPQEKDISRTTIGRYMMYKELDAMFRNGDVPMIDFRNIFDEYPDKSQEVFYDSCHVRRPANKFLAERILALVLEK